MKSRLHRFLTLFFMAMLVITGSAFSQDSGMPQIDVVNNSGGGDEHDYGIEKETVMYSPGEIDTRFTSGGSASTTLPERGDSVNSSTSTAVPSVPIPKIKIEKQAPVTKPTVEKQSMEEDDSILSFNFLYYIIQKYKLQDIVD
jgi:hypothetical protein